MHKITFECETITPMFLSGADGSTPELRPPSIKGALRFWWRAMNGDLDLKTLKEREGEIFGDTKRRSAFSIKTSFSNSNFISAIKNTVNNKIESVFKNEFDLEWNQNDKEGPDSGIGYLYYSALFQNHRSFITTTTQSKFTFDITFSYRDEEIAKKVICAFWLFIHFGGLGTRVRRGAGCLHAVLKEDTEDLVSGITYEVDGSQKGICFDSMSNNIETYLKQNIEIAKHYTITQDIHSTNTNSFSHLMGSKLVVGKGKQNWQTSLVEVGNSFKSFRTNHKHDNSLLGSAIFGLPISHGGRDGKPRIFVQPEDRNIKRRSSPLILKILKYNNQFHWVAVRLNGEFLPAGNNKISNGKQRNNGGKSNPAITTLLNSFWNDDLKSELSGTEITL
jgi:CRISPR-associated protein Cmr1